MDHTVAVRTSTRLFSITKDLAVRHGRITDLKICLGAFLEVREFPEGERAPPRRLVGTTPTSAGGESASPPNPASRLNLPPPQTTKTKTKNIPLCDRSVK